MNKFKPQVSVIVPTRNSDQTLEACLGSIRKQSYANIELIVVDRNSTDNTKKIAKKFTQHVYDKEPERSAQRNFGVSRANGDFVLIIDSDMELSEHVVTECVAVMQKNNQASGVIIPEESFGEGFWAQCKKLERSFYIGVDWMEAARFFKRTDYLALGGYNESLVSGEDWDLSNRMKKLGKIERIQALIYHNEGRINLIKTLRKKTYYAEKIGQYVEANQDSTSTGSEIGRVFKRFGLYFSKPHILFRRPLIGIGMLFMKISEFGFGFVGWVKSR